MLIVVRVIHVTGEESYYIFSKGTYKVGRKGMLDWASCYEYFHLNLQFYRSNQQITSSNRHHRKPFLMLKALKNYFNQALCLNELGSATSLQESFSYILLCQGL